MLSSRYWAEWDPNTAAPNIIRRDTRLYWEPQVQGIVGKCIGTFIGENPGGAESIYGLGFVGHSPIQHRNNPGDPTLRLLFEVWQAGTASARIKPVADDYIEILNTYYFRNPKAGKALTAWRSAGGPKLYFPLPRPASKFIILGWGVGHNGSNEAAALVPHLATWTLILIPDSSARVTVKSGMLLTSPVTPSPAAPSWILRRSALLKSKYIHNLAVHIP